MKAKMKLHKLLSLLLALVMVVGMLPAMGQVAYAASAVSNLTWDGNTAKWDSDGSASQYRVTLRTYPSDTVIANDVVDVTSIDYSSYLLPGNTYYFRVAPIVGSEQQSFVIGPTKTIDGSRGTISPITIDSVKKTATWTSVTGADGYDVWVLRNGAQIGFVRQTTDTSFDFSSDYKDTGNGEYSIYVRAYKMSRGNYLAEGESSKVTLNELPDTVTIHFDSNGGTDTMDDVTVAYAANYTLPECSFTPPANMEFSIWETPGGQITAGSSTKFFENTTVKALWKAKTYTVTFDPGEGSGTSFIRKVNAGEKLSLPSCSFTAPENKVFDKWDMGEPSDKIDVSGDMTVTALWKDAETYTVTVNNDGNGTAFASPTSGPDGTVVTLTATPNPGYKFKEWTRQAGMLSGGTSIPNAISATTTFTISGYNVVVTATFEEDGATTHTVTFDPGEGSGTPFTESVNAGEKLTLPSCSFTHPENKVFDKWDKGEPNEQIDVSGDMTVTALWKDASGYTVTVNNDGNGTAFASPTSGPDGTVVTLTATPNPGYKFKEWTRQAGMLSGGTSIPNATSATTTFTISGYNVVVTATFEEDGTIPLPEYDITVTDGKATVGAGTEISKAAEGTTVTLTANAAPTDKVFDKWEVVSGSIALADANSATTTFTMPAGEVIVKATYKDKPVTTYTVSFDANGGTGSMADVTGVSGEYTLPANGFTAPAGKQFKCWSVDGVEKAVGDKITVTANTTVTAVWEAIEYNVTVIGGTASVGAGTPITKATMGTTVTLTAGAAPSGQMFDKWIVNGVVVADANSATTTFVMPAGAVSVTATYKTLSPDEYTVTFNANGHGTAPVAQTVESGKTAAKPANPSEDGWTFCGWYTNQDCSQSQYFDFSTAITGDITLYAKWKQNETSDTYWSGLYTNRSPHGKVNLNGYGISTNTGSYFAAETELIAYAYPDEGYRFKEWQDEAGDVVSTNNPYTFTLNSATYLYAIFEAAPTASTEYDITVTGGKATVGAGTEITKAAEGTTVTLTANAAPSGQVFDKWVVVSGSITLADASSATTTFTMPAGAVSVTATYKAAPHTHTFDQEIVKDAALKTAADCTHDAVYYKSCSCGAISTTATFTEIGSALGHDYTKKVENNTYLKTAASNCTEYNVYWYACSRCDANAKDEAAATDKYYTSTTAGNHSFTEKIEDAAHYVAGTGTDCQSVKKYYFDCAYCDQIGTTTWDSTTYGEHNYAATWSSDASGHWHACSRCDAKDGEAAHTPDREAATETDPIKCTECDYIITPALGHTHSMTLVDEKPATCTEDGNKAYYVCSGCSKWFEDATGSVEITDHSSVVIGKLGHDCADATCTASKTCSRCGATEGTALGHDFADVWSSDASGHWHACSRCDAKDGEAAHTPDREAVTETNPIKCTECDYIITPALGHTHSLTKVEAKAPTCTEDGNIEYYTCSGCSKLFADATGNVEITADKTVDKATGHTYEWVIDKEATATEKGSKHEECKVCHDKKAAVEIPATGTPTDPTDPVEPTDPSKPTESNPDTGASDNPQTGDNRMMALSIAVLFVSGFGVVATAVYGKKKKSVK